MLAPDGLAGFRLGEYKPGWYATALRSQNRAGKKPIDGFFVVMPARHCLSLGSHLARQACAKKLLRGGNCTCTPVLASFVAACSSCLTALVPSSTPFLTSRHANGLSLGIRRYQRCGGCCDCESSSFSEKRKGTSTRDSFRFDDFAHGQRLLGLGEGPCGCRCKVPVLI
jgi:hypothetical protein